MDIVDSQVHMGPGGIDAMLAAMNALGIRSVLIDEAWMRNQDPGYPLRGGAFRSIAPTAELAACLHPARFAYLVRVDPRDPDLRSWLRVLRDTPHARAVRVVPGLSPQESAAFASGEYDDVFASALDCGLPVFVFAPGSAAAVRAYAKRFPSLKLIVDHCGMPFRMRDAPPLERAAVLAAFAEVLQLAEHPNVALKWGHAAASFAVPGFPGEALRPFLRQALDRFGAERVMWASDFSMNQSGETWAELLFSHIVNPDLSDHERSQVLGGSVRKWLDWPA